MSGYFYSEIEKTLFRVVDDVRTSIVRNIVFYFESNENALKYYAGDTSVNTYLVNSGRLEGQRVFMCSCSEAPKNALTINMNMRAWLAR